MLKIKQFVFSMFGVNTYLAIDADTKEAAVIDPAMADAEEEKRFDEYVAKEGAKITQIINTHLHLDHCFGINYVKDKYGVPVAAHIDDAPLGKAMGMQLARFGLSGSNKELILDANLADGDVVEIGDSRLSVIHVPGHTPGGIALYDKEDNVVFTGDTLFRRSVGRTDLGGNQRQLTDSIRTKLFTLPEPTLVLPGHGEHTTIGEEKHQNPYV